MRVHAFERTGDGTRGSWYLSVPYPTEEQKIHLQYVLQPLGKMTKFASSKPATDHVQKSGMISRLTESKIKTQN